MCVLIHKVAINQKTGERFLESLARRGRFHRDLSRLFRRSIGWEITKTLKQRLRALFVIYCCICLIGCATRGAIEYAQETGETETHHWNVDAVTFAAIRDDRFVRVCVELSDSDATTETELTIDLQEITDQFNRLDTVVGTLEDGVNTESYICGLELESDEKALPVSVIDSNASDIVEELQLLNQKAKDELVLVLLHHDTGSYLVFGAPVGMYKGLDEHALGGYTAVEHHHSSSIFILLPIAVAVDAVIIGAIVMLLFVCVWPIFWPICFPLVGNA